MLKEVWDVENQEVESIFFLKLTAPSLATPEVNLLSFQKLPRLLVSQ